LLLYLLLRLPPISTLFPYTTLFRSAPRAAFTDRLRAHHPVFRRTWWPAAPGTTPGCSRCSRGSPGRGAAAAAAPPPPPAPRARRDRKSTRLNSSHVKISYAVFCLKK